MLLASAMPAAAQDWRLISGEANGESALFRDVDSIQPELAGEVRSASSSSSPIPAFAPCAQC
ncbi:MAG: hypothetical protein CMN73_12480 [Sphingomonas sp.]|nr:hypothetical protein [Sphingomonas sp.]